MEKQLELKEASTRRRILALKQQLQSGNKPPATAPAKQSMYISATNHTNDAKKAPIPMSKNDQTVSSSNVHNRTEMTVRLSDSPIQMLTSPSHKVRNASTQGNNETRAVCVQQIGDSERIKLSAPTEISKASLIPQAIHHINNLAPHTLSSKSDPPFNNKKETKLIDTKVVNQVPSTSSMTSPSSRTPRPNSRQKLTLPEEIKETEYMSALQRQKARVSRIRRCIVAATVIQRAWRDYTDKKSCMHAYD